MRKLAILLLASAAATSLAAAANAADLSAPMAPPTMAPAPAPASNWTGAYVGANLGYSWDKVTADTGFGSEIDGNGGFVGGQVGYNFQLDNGVVVGLQGDLDWANIKGTDTNGLTDTIDWTGAITGHVGYAFDAVMPYVLGGVAFANNKIESGANSETQVHTGWTVGAGAEVMLASNISAFAEYRYSDYGSKDYTNPAATGVHPTDNSIRAGLNFHF